MKKANAVMMIGKSHQILKAISLVFILLACIPIVIRAQTTIFTESIGTVGGTTSIAAHETANGFDNDTYTMTQGGIVSPGDIRVTSPSAGYTGASGLANVWLTSTSGSYGFAIEGIDASTYTSLTVQFGYRKEAAASLPALALDYWDGASWVNVSFTFNEASGATAGWYLSPVISLPAGAQINGLKLRWVKSGTVACRLDDIILKGTLASSNTITTGAVTGSPFNVDCTTGASGTVAFTSTGTFNAGNIYTAQLSNNTGSFAAPINIGTLSSNANSGTINIIIPAATITGAGYKIRVVSSNPVATGSSSGVITVSLTGSCCPRMTGALINSCNGSCSEGDNEILFFNSGSYSIPVSPANIVVKYQSTNPPTDTYTDNFTSNASYITTLNTNAGCGTIFYDALTAGTIPANSIFLIMRSTACYSYNFSAFCGLGNIYVLFSTDPTWIVSGNFSNGGTLPGVLRYFRIDFSAVIPGCITDYNYEPYLLTTQGDGDAISFPVTGGAADQYFNNGCVPPPVVLPIELISFEAKNIENLLIGLNWTTSTEINNDYFTVERSQNAEVFIPVLTVQGAGNSNTIKEYSALDSNPIKGLSYYRLKQTDYNGAFSYSKAVPVMINNSGSLEIISTTSDENLINIYIYSEDASMLNIDITNLLGQTIVSARKEKAEGAQIISINKNNIDKGLYLLRVSDNQTTIVKKICL